MCRDLLKKILKTFLDLINTCPFKIQGVRLYKPNQVAEVQKVSDDGVFTMTVGPSATTTTLAPLATDNSDTASSYSHPHPRMNCGLAVRRGCLYLYGGLYEQGERTLTFSDLHVLGINCNSYQSKLL